MRGRSLDRTSHRGTDMVGLLGMAWLAAILSAIYLPDLGRGFLRDDFVWIHDSRLASLGDLVGLFGRHNGFYRPIVATTFGLSDRLVGLDPFAYGLTNLALVVAVALLIVRVLGALGMPRGVRLFAAAIWALNFHGINMAVMWISGRTALLLTAFALLAAHAVIRRRPLWAAAWTAAALFSKEEAVLLPAILFAWIALQEEDVAETLFGRLVRAFSRTWPAFAALVPYCLLRVNSGAFMPWNAPAYYRFTTSPPRLLNNAVEYLDRSSTLALVVTLALVALARGAGRLDRTERRWVALGLAWLFGGFAVTLFLPVRSSLYACWPSVGTSIVAATIAGASWRRLDARTARRIAAAGLVLPVLLLPLYWSRNVRMKREAELSSTVVAEIGRASATWSDGDAIVVRDEPGRSPSIASTFDALLPEAILLTTGKRLRVLVEPPLADGQSSSSGDAAKPVAVFEMTDGRFRRVD